MIIFGLNTDIVLSLVLSAVNNFQVLAIKVALRFINV